MDGLPVDEQLGEVLEEGVAALAARCHVLKHGSGRGQSAHMIGCGGAELLHSHGPVARQGSPKGPQALGGIAAAQESSTQEASSDAYQLGASSLKQDVEASWNGLEAKESFLPGAGKGLFATRRFKQDDVVCEYKSTDGSLISTREAMRLKDKSYLMRLGPQAYINLREDMSVAARYLNDCRNPRLHNIVFEKRPEEGRALAVATRDIEAGEELYVDYGKWYWAGWKEKPSRLD